MNRIRFLRFTGISEGVSFLVLLLIAMPLKYYAGLPIAVKVVGWMHGVLFMAYLVAVFAAIKPMKWGLRDFAIAMGASLLPFATFLLDRSWRERARQLQILEN